MTIKVAMISPDSLPVPAVKGGAIQLGIQQIIDENEKLNMLDLTVYSVFDEEARAASEKYQNTRFHFIKSANKSFAVKRINNVLNFLNIRHRFDVNPGYTKSLCEQLSKNRFDTIIIKNTVRFVEPISKITTDPIWLQLHNDNLNNCILRCKPIYGACRKVLVNSHYLKKRVLTIENARSEDVFVHKNCTDIHSFKKEQYSNEIKELKNKYKIHDDDIVILYSGRTVPEKGIKELIMAVKKLPEGLKFKLLIVGSKGFGKKVTNIYLYQLKKIADSIRHKIIFTGFIQYHDLPKIHAISDMAVVPSIWEEPAGRVITEAMASGLPVIASGSGGMEDYINKESTIIVRRGKTFIEDLSSEIKRLMEDKLLRERMGKAGQEFVKKFDSYIYYKQLIEFLKR